MKRQLAVGAFVVAPLLLLGAVVAQASMVNVEFLSFSQSDGNNATGFAIPGSPSGNSLFLDVSGFSAEATGAGAYENVFDTIAFQVKAPEGYYIKSILYSEAVSSVISGGGVVIGAGSAVIAGKASDLGSHVYTSDTHATILSTGLINLVGQLTTVDVSITNQVTAVALAGGSAEIKKGFDIAGDPVPTILTVNIEAIPLPPAVWLLGSALLGVGVLGRRRARLAG